MPVRIAQSRRMPRHCRIRLEYGAITFSHYNPWIVVMDRTSTPGRLRERQEVEVVVIRSNSAARRTPSRCAAPPRPSRPAPGLSNTTQPILKKKKKKKKKVKKKKKKITYCCERMKCANVPCPKWSISRMSTGIPSSIERANAVSRSAPLDRRASSSCVQSIVTSSSVPEPELPCRSTGSTVTAPGRTQVLGGEHAQQIIRQLVSPCRRVRGRRRAIELREDRVADHPRRRLRVIKSAVAPDPTRGARSAAALPRAALARALLQRDVAAVHANRRRAHELELRACSADRTCTLLSSTWAPVAGSTPSTAASAAAPARRQVEEQEIDRHRAAHVG